MKKSSSMMAEQPPALEIRDSFEPMKEKIGEEDADEDYEDYEAEMKDEKEEVKEKKSKKETLKDEKEE